VVFVEPWTRTGARSSVLMASAELILGQVALVNAYLQLLECKIRLNRSPGLDNLREPFRRMIDQARSAASCGSSGSIGAALVIARTISETSRYLLDPAAPPTTEQTLSATADRLGKEDQCILEASLRRLRAVGNRAAHSEMDGSVVALEDLASALESCNNLFDIVRNIRPRQRSLPIAIELGEVTIARAGREAPLPRNTASAPEQLPIPQPLTHLVELNFEERRASFRWTMPENTVFPVNDIEAYQVLLNGINTGERRITRGSNRINILDFEAVDYLELAIRLKSSQSEWSPWSNPIIRCYR
jgi:hypothetical protein